MKPSSSRLRSVGSECSEPNIGSSTCHNSSTNDNKMSSVIDDNSNPSANW